MARAKPPAMPPAEKPKWSRQNIERGIARLQDRISELEAFQVNTVRRGNTPELEGLETAIKDTLTRCFGENTSTYNHFQGAAQLTYYPRFLAGDVSPDYIGPIEKHIKTAIVLLDQAQRTLREGLTDSEHESYDTTSTLAVSKVFSRRVFVIHGHDDGSREMVARFLERTGFEAIILHE